MPVRLISGDQTIGAGRGEAVVCIPAYGPGGELATCLQALIEHTPAAVPVLVSGGARDDKLLEGVGLDRRLLFHLRVSDSRAVASLVEAGVAAAAPADVVVVDPGCAVAEGWFEGLRDAARVDSTVATASALTTADLGATAGDAGAGGRDGGAGGRQRLEALAAAIRSASPRARPRVPRAGRDCVYVRRAAIELVGDVGSRWANDAAAPDFLARCLHSGLSHVVADDVVVAGSGSFAGAPASDPAARPPSRAGSPLARSLSAARRAAHGLSIVVDARILGTQVTGTQLHVLQLVAALARTGKGRVRVLVPGGLDVDSQLRGLAGVEVVRAADAALIAPGDVVHRPFQVSSLADLRLLRRLGERLVVTNQDLIGYRNSSYFASARAWSEYRDLTRRALAVADRVVFPSSHALRDALAEDLVDPERASVVPLGVDHSLRGARLAAVRPSAAAALPNDGEVILCLGTDLRHKNRVFALRVVDELQRIHAWDGHLVLAGPHLAPGSSSDEEARLLARSERLAARTIDARAVADAEKLWLLRRAALVLYPTVYEGFGLVPFEAADEAVPCMWAPAASLADLLPAGEAAIVPWDARATAERAARLLDDRAAAAGNVAAVRAAGAGLTWDATAERLLEVYGETCDRPASGAGVVARMAPETSVSEDGLRLVGPGGALPPELERPLLALATHARLAAPVLGSIRAGYRAAHFLRTIARPARRHAGRAGGERF